jgi:hypothetical protein
LPSEWPAECGVAITFSSAHSGDCGASGSCSNTSRSAPASAPQSPLWALENVIATPHSAGHSDGNEERVDAMFMANLARWAQGEPLAKLAG